MTTYSKRGVSSDKKQVHDAIKKLDKGIYPTAFCKILPDILGGDSRYCNIMHADTAGTKPSLAYLWYEETGDEDMFGASAEDALAMNTDDVGCAGAEGPMLVNQTIGQNTFVIPTGAVAKIIQRAQAFCDMLCRAGIQCEFAGGETADVPDIVRTIDVGSSVTVRMKRSHVIDAGNISPGNLLVGFSSIGKAAWETGPNSGIGSNGLTNARHEALSKMYRKYKEAYCPELAKKLVFRGRHKMTDSLPGNPLWNIGEALMSPTRTYLPLMKMLFDEVGREHLTGLIHCSGGSLEKIRKFGKPGNVYVKDNLFPIPPVVHMLRENGLTWWEIFKSLNAGHRLEAAVPDKKVAEDCIAISRAVGIDAQIIGFVKAGKGERKVKIISPHGKFSYPLPKGQQPPS